MIQSFIQSPWPFLLVFGYLLVTLVLYVLAARRRNQLTIHDRILEAKQIRSEYLNDLERRESADVEIIG